MGQKKNETWSQPSLFDGTIEGLRAGLLSTPTEKLPQRILPQLVQCGIYPSIHRAKRDWLDSTRKLEEGVHQPPSITFTEYLSSLRAYHLELIDLVLSGESPNIATAQEYLRQEFRRRRRAKESS